ncbi:MAG: EAL domain-containing protein [Halofilum sp. (in: g-proteobacteria)]|nr:EAL domain-containing protein [Halofilum sp. (in: g-proteobacteria)]
MNLYRLSLFSIVGCLTGLVLLLLVTLQSADQVRAKQAEIGDLLELRGRIDDFSAASDSLVLSGADPGLWRAYRAEAQVLRERLGRLGESHPDASKAARRIDAMVGSVAAALDIAGADAGTGFRVPDTNRAIGSLDVPPRSRIIMQQVAGQGIALDTALDDVLHERQQAIAREATWIGATLAGSALLFGALCVVAFGLIHGRVGRPARALVDTLENIRAGNTHARAPITGKDELARVAATLNRMLDERESAERALQERQQHLEQALAELEQTRDRLLRAQRVGRIGSWEVDLAAERLEWSDQVFEIFGIRREDFAGTEEAFFELVHPDDREWLREERADWLERGGVLDAEHRIVRPDGEIRWVRERARVFAGADGRPERMAGVVQDVSDLHQLNARLRQYERLIENSTDRFCIIDSNFRYVLADETYAALYGLDRKAVEGSHVRDIAGAEFFEREVRERIHRCLSGEIVQFEARRTYDSIGTVHFLIEYYPLPGPAGTIHEVAAVLTDITEQKRLDERARQFHALVEGHEDLCAISDADGRFVWVNHAYAARHGLSEAEIHGRHISEAVGEEVYERDIRWRVERCLQGEPQRYEMTREYPDLGARNVLVRYVPIPDRDGTVVNVGAVITDVTELRATQEAMNRQGALLDMAGRAARFGGWSVDLREMQVEWSDITAEIHGMPRGYSPSVEEGIAFYAPEYRDRIRQLFAACVEHGEPYDEELQIIDADGQRVWVRTVGEAVRDGDGTIVRIQGAFQDISARKAAEQERHRLHNRLAAMLEAITDGFVAFDNHWRYTYVNVEGARMLGKSTDELLGTTVWAQFPDLAGTRTEGALRRAMHERVSRSVEEFFEPLGAWFDVHVYPWEEGLAVFFRDVTESHRMIEQLQAQEADLRASRDELDAALDTRQALINSLPAHIALLDGDGTIVDVNEQWRHFGEENDFGDDEFGVGHNYIQLCENAKGECSEEAGIVAAGLREVLAGDRSVFTLEYPCHSPTQQRWFRVMFNRLSSGESMSRGAVAMHIDITERKLAELELNRVAYEDRLTGLLSRNGFGEALGKRLRKRRKEIGGLVIMLDLIGQRDINDAHGYDQGDRLLGDFAARLRARVPDEALVARVGGDEFALYLPPKRGQEPEHAVEQLIRDMDEPFVLATGSVDVSFNIGFTEVGSDNRDVNGLLREAELALFQVRSQRTDSPSEWLAYTAQLDESVHERIQITQELRRALQHDEFELHFQPKVDLRDGRLLSGEALIRWNHPERGLQPPGRFIPVAEQSQLIGPIGDWALRDACRQLREWSDAGLEIVRIAVNVSLVQFVLGDFAARVRAMLDEFGLDPSSLSLEITESVFEHESELLLEQIRELHELGVRLSLDDFGTGYSSLLYLQRYPFDEIKVDRGFVSRVVDNAYSREIVSTVVGLAGALGAEVVAEGIETPEVQAALLDLGCTTGQGFYYSMPLEAEDFRWLLEQRSKLPLARAMRG